MDPIILFYVLLFVVATLYASVGHGGASGYLALMAIYGVVPDTMKPTALLLNLFVSLTAFIQFYRGGHFSWKIFLPLAITSVPFAYLGGLVAIKAVVYKRILGLFLIIPIVRFLFFRNVQVNEMKESKTWISVLLGSGIGYLSGLIGIGGGILLSPILLMLKWTNQKQAAAISALFIFVNSLAGLAGQMTKGIQFTQHMIGYVVVAFAGGLLGAYLGALKFNQQVLKYALAFVLAMASYKLLFTTA
ncbi:MAG TPA: sulfite exporter TauE/SafE family protein [Phnomibacter sp.]|nr:sulfite exporter TauE/SafE family protein [Phnomibacter sp.]